jgi:L-ectoine synthase
VSVHPEITPPSNFHHFRDTTYALDKHQKHILSSEEGMTVLCVFTPSLVGPEDHDEEGSYPLYEDDGTVVKH